MKSSSNNQLSEHWKKWLEVGKVVAADPNVKVKCPMCAEAELIIWDQHWKQDPSRWERYMRCPECGATNIILMKSGS